MKGYAEHRLEIEKFERPDMNDNTDGKEILKEKFFFRLSKPLEGGIFSMQTISKSFSFSGLGGHVFPYTICKRMG